MATIITGSTFMRKILCSFTDDFPLNSLSAIIFQKGNQPPPAFSANFAKFPILVKSNSIKLWPPFTHFLKAECLPKPIKQILIGYLCTVFRPFGLNMVRFWKKCKISANNWENGRFSFHMFTLSIFTTHARHSWYKWPDTYRCSQTYLYYISP